MTEGEASVTNRPAMEIRDLRTHPPRRWSESVDGIRWLPRLIDKTRAALSGSLGDYLYGQSPVDREFLRALGVGYAGFTRIVRESPNDESVVARLREADPAGIERAREWSRSLPRRWWYFLPLLDLDDGYVPAPLRSLKAPANGISAALTRWLKRRYPIDTGANR
jgi:hypothetical protein